MTIPKSLILPLLLAGLAVGKTLFPKEAEWNQIETKGKSHQRHEHAFVEVGGLYYSLGGRGVRPVDIFDPKTNTWTIGSKPPFQIHHFQALAWEGKVLIAGAFTGGFPGETPVPHCYFYDPKTDQWTKGPEIPEGRRRGSAGAFIRDGKLYLVSGLTDGHRSGWVPWFDEYDFATDTWKPLPDAPRSRDHFQAVLIEDQLVLAGGRRSGENGNVFAYTVAEVDVYDFASEKWRTLPAETGNIPTPRAGCMAFGSDKQVIVIGGESKKQTAHDEVEILNMATETWSAGPSLSQGRHATQPVFHNNAIYLQAGSLTKGGRGETNTLEVIQLNGAH